MTKVTSDLFDVVQRLREIDEYEVFWRGELYEIRIRDQRAFECEVLDERVLWRARMTRVENLDFDLIMAHNLEIESSATRKMEQSTSALVEMFEYAHQTSQDVTFSKRRLQI